MNRRCFLKTAAFATGSAAVLFQGRAADSAEPAVGRPLADLPVGGSPPPVPFPQFPDRLHAFVWRNWPVVPLDRMARTIGANPDELVRIGKSMGLPDPPAITDDQRRRSYITVIKRNWHLLPYDQLLTLLDWTPQRLAYTLREDDFLFTKLGNLKPHCDPLRFAPPRETAQRRAREIARVIEQEFPHGLGTGSEPLFAFVSQLSSPLQRKPPGTPEAPSVFSPRFCYSYFALYGDPLLDTATDSYPDGYLARMAACGVDGVWLQAVLYKLAPFPWDEELSRRHEERLRNLEALVARARRHGMGLYLYLNEPRAMPLAFYKERPSMKGVVEGDHAALCTSHPDVQKYLVNAVARVVRNVPDLAGLFTITGSENLTHCWSHGNGTACPRCKTRGPATVIAELNGLFREGIRQGGGKTRLIVWDWGWHDDWTEAIINGLPDDAAFMSVSEWGIPIRRGGVSTTVGEYSISTIGPGARATRHWAWARRRGLKTIAKIQAGNTWELSAVPYIPAVENVAHHAANLRQAHVDGVMLGWTLGGYPSPNLEVVSAVGSAGGDHGEGPSVEEALVEVARRRYGSSLATSVARAWRAYSAAFSEFPFHASLVYSAPLQLGPANLLWEKPTGYRASMVGFPYDDVDGWRAVYPTEVLISQFEKIAGGFEGAIAELRKAIGSAKAHRGRDEGHQ